MFRLNKTGLLHVSTSLCANSMSVLIAPITDRLLMPCFGAANIHNMFDGMVDVVSQLVLKWER